MMYTFIVLCIFEGEGVDSGEFFKFIPLAFVNLSIGQL